MEDPALTPHGLRDDEIGTLSAQEVPEFAAHQFVESLDGNQKLPACRMPGGGVLGYTAAADQAVNVWVQVQLLSPRVQHGEHGHGAADITGIAGEFDDRPGTGLHQHGIAVSLMSTQHLAQLGGHGDGDVEMRHRQHLRPAAFEPLLGLCGVALRATAVGTGVPGEHLGIALLAAPNLAAKCRGAAVEDVLDGALM